MKYEAVVFDMDGVIFDSEREVMISWREVADKYGIKGIEDACKKCLGCTYDRTREIMHELYGDDFPYESYKKEASDIFHKRNDGGKLPKKPGVIELLSYLKENNIPIALASSTRREVVVQELSEGGIIQYFDKLICGDMVERSKPAPDIFLKACSELGVNPENSIAIEDSYNGIRSAHAAGMIPIMVPDMVQPDEEIREKAFCVCESLSEVKRLIMVGK